MVPGRYVRVPPGTPHYPFFHRYGSRLWTANNLIDYPTAESKTAVHKWTAGVGPVPFPPARLIGSPDCIRLGEPVPDVPFVDEFGPMSTNEQKLPFYFTSRLADSIECGGTWDFRDWSGGYAFSMNFKVPTSVILRWKAKLSKEQFHHPPVVAIQFVCPQIRLDFQFDRELAPGDECGPFDYSGEIPLGMLLGRVEFGCSINRSRDSFVGQDETLEVSFVYDPSPTAEKVIQGFDAKCFDEEFAGNVESHSLRDKEELAVHARIIEDLYVNFGAAKARAEAWGGPLMVVTGNPVTPLAGSGVLVGIHPLRQFVWAVGTTTNAQLIQQAAEMIAGPVDFGLYGSETFWKTTSGRIGVQLTMSGVDATKPLTLYGHSLGGAACTLLGLDLAFANGNFGIEVGTFGSPRPGDERLSELLLQLSCVHVVNSLDPVPFTSPSFAELGPLALLVPPAWLVTLPQWRNQPGRWALYADGDLVEGGFVEVVDAALASIVAAWLLNVAEDDGAGHTIAAYRMNLEK